MKPSKPTSIQCLPVGRMAANCYLVIDSHTNRALIIDPGDDAQYIAQHLEDTGAKPTAIIATHGHFDHILAAHELQMIYEIPFRCHKADMFLVSAMQKNASYFLGRTIVEIPPVVSSTLRDGEIITIGKTECKVCHTPGHTPGGICISVETQNRLFVGDTIFADGGVGRTDFSYADAQQLGQSIRTILSFPKTTVLFPGHGEQTTVAKESDYHIDLCK